MTFPTLRFARKAIKSNGETDTLIAILSKTSMGKISFNLEDKYFWKVLNSQHHRINYSWFSKFKVSKISNLKIFLRQI